MMWLVAGIIIGIILIVLALALLAFWNAYCWDNQYDDHTIGGFINWLREKK